MTGRSRVFMCVRLILLIHVLVYRIDGARQMKCEELTVPMCKNLGYNVTHMPNRFNHEDQKSVTAEVHQFWPLVGINCSHVLHFFLCSVYAPVCDKTYGKELVPCRSVCEHAKAGCSGIMKKYNFKWPEKIECDQWPTKEEDPLCMAPKEELPRIDKTITLSPSWPPQNKPSPSLDGSSPSSAGRTCRCSCQAPFVPVDRSLDRSVAGVKDCALPCNASFFSNNRKEFATTWVTLWSTLCFISTFVTLATFFIDTARFGYPERPVIFLSGCYLMLSFGYILRLIAGERALICDSHDLITSETTGPPLCTLVFLFTYFGGMASALWWVILAFTWFLAAGMKWSNESISNVSQYFHIVAWLIPSVQTISVLAMSSIDGDPLNGICYVGNQNKDSLIVFVIVPLGIYLSIGTAFLVAGFFSLIRIRNAMRNDGNSTNKLEKLMVRIGVFSVLYTVPATVTIGCYFYEMTNRDDWEKSLTCRGCSSEGDQKEPEFSAFMVKYFMSLVVGISTGFWICSMKTLDSWRTLLNRFKRAGLRKSGDKQIEKHETISLRTNVRTDV